MKAAKAAGGCRKIFEGGPQNRPSKTVYERVLPVMTGRMCTDRNKRSESRKAYRFHRKRMKRRGDAGRKPIFIPPFARLQPISAGNRQKGRDYPADRPRQARPHPAEPDTRAGALRGPVFCHFAFLPSVLASFSSFPSFPSSSASSLSEAFAPFLENILLNFSTMSGDFSIRSTTLPTAPL